MTEPGRPEFREWVDGLEKPPWGLMPLTHICKSLIGGDIVREGRIEPTRCSVFESDLAYFFYGRPAYRVQGDGAVKTPAACPMCFVFRPELISRAQSIHPFDTGAYHARMYSHAVMEEMNIEDFSLGQKSERINKLISFAYKSREAYYDGAPAGLPSPTSLVSPADFLATAYIQLIESKGRNEPDDRLGTIEVVFGESVQLAGDLLAAIVSDVLWNDKDRASWLLSLSGSGVEVIPFRYAHAKSPDYHHAMIEAEMHKLLISRGDV